MRRLIECRNGDDCSGLGVFVASCAADGGVGGAALKTAEERAGEASEQNRKKFLINRVHSPFRCGRLG